MGTYQILPPLSTEERARLTESIREHGVKVAVVMDERGEIIDGHHRAEIADALGVPYAILTETGLAEHEKRILALTLNVDRRQLTDAQRVLVAEKVAPDFKERARLRQIELAGTRPSTSRTDVLEVSPTPVQARDEIAKAAGIGSGRTLERHTKAVQAARDTLGAEVVDEQIERGAVTIADLVKQTNQAKDAESASLIATMTKGDDFVALRFRQQLSKKLVHLAELVLLTPEAIAAYHTDDDLIGLRLQIRMTREWMDAVEQAIKPRGLHVVK